MYELKLNILDEKIKRMTQDMLDMMIYPTVKCSLADCQQATAEPCKPKRIWDKACNENKKEEIPMSAYSSATVITADSIEAQQRKTLKSALYDAFRAKVFDAKKKFGLVDDDAPETIKDFFARVAAGKYVIKEKYEEMSAYNFISYVQWRDPSVKEDKDGYKAARADLDKEHSALELRIAILPIADALTAVETYRDGK